MCARAPVYVVSDGGTCCVDVAASATVADLIAAIPELDPAETLADAGIGAQCSVVVAPRCITWRACGEGARVSAVDPATVEGGEDNSCTIATVAFSEGTHRWRVTVVDVKSPDTDGWFCAGVATPDIDSDSDPGVQRCATVVWGHGGSSVQEQYRCPEWGHGGSSVQEQYRCPEWGHGGSSVQEQYCCP
eukprot:gene50956-61843_t